MFGREKKSELMVGNISSIPLFCHLCIKLTCVFVFVRFCLSVRKMRTKEKRRKSRKVDKKIIFLFHFCLFMLNSIYIKKCDKKQPIFLSISLFHSIHDSFFRFLSLYLHWLLAAVFLHYLHVSWFSFYCCWVSWFCVMRAPDDYHSS